MVNVYLGLNGKLASEFEFPFVATTELSCTKVMTHGIPDYSAVDNAARTNKGAVIRATKIVELVRLHCC